MNILQFCYKPPYPAVDGGTIGMHSISEGLVNLGCKVKILTFCSDKNPFNKSLLPSNYIQTYNPEAVYVNLKPNIFDAFLYILIARSYIVERFVTSEMKKKLIRILKSEDFDIVQIESINLAPYIPLIRQHSKSKIAFHCPNVEHLIWQRIYKNEKKNIFKRWYLKNTAQNMKFYELNNINNFDVIFPVTDKDAQYFKQAGCIKPCIGVPIGFHTTQEITDVMQEDNSLFHIGSMNWFPNQQGIKWFLNEVWQHILHTAPQVKLYLAGRHMPAWLQNGTWQNVDVVGEVADSTLFMCSKRIMVVPLLSGSGIRIKILEAMSLGKTVVATTIAAEGIMYTEGQDIIIADTPEEFALAVKRLIEDKEYCDRIGENARKLIKEKYGTNIVAEQILNYYNQMLQN
ncbi:MAG: glycosyltransferase family 4 protein, partial [Bacteroidales bacterium]|nr:glycosyltransferase family 4 protein [Bacteroidales bacterium]